VAPRGSSDATDLRQRVADCLQKLPEDLKAIIRDFFAEGLPISEIAAKCRMSPNAAKAAKRNALERLRKCVG
jgi:RNA polymerase sigma factor (sigma-70 family)